MSSFLQKLKGRGLGVTEDNALESIEHTKSAAPLGVAQLPVDVCQTDTEITVYAQVPGSDIDDLDVSIEGDNDIITIQGTSGRPQDLAPRAASEIKVSVGRRNVVHHEEEAEFVLEECVWGKFFRQIILPQEVDAAGAQAKIKDGVLVLHLPLKGQQTNKLRMSITKVGSN
jgi:HSP20 family molecular chaperone IbpA